MNSYEDRRNIRYILLDKSWVFVCDGNAYFVWEKIGRMDDGALLCDKDSCVLLACSSKDSKNAIYAKRFLISTILVIKMMRQIALFGVAIALTAPLPFHSNQKDREEHS